MKIKIENFRCLESIELDTDNVITLKGNNEAGKTSVIKAIEQLMLGGTNAGKYIRSGTTDFRIAAYIKEKNLTVVRKSKGYKIYEGDCLDKKNEKNCPIVHTVEKLTSNDTPEVVANIFGVTRNSVTGGLIGSRGYTGTIPFVETSSSENYTMVTEELGASRFKSAAYGGHKEANRLKRETKKLQESLTDLEMRERLATEELEKSKELERVLVSKDGIHDALISTIKSVVAYEDAMKEADGVVEDFPQEIDILMVQAIENVTSAVQAYKSAKQEVANLHDNLPELIDLEKVQGIENVKGAVKNYKDAKEELEKASAELKELEAKIKSMNIKDMQICPVCGALLINGECVEE